MFTGAAAPKTAPGRAAQLPAGATVRVGGAGPDATRKSGADGQKKSGGLKWAIIGVVALALIGGGGYAAKLVIDQNDQRIAEEEAAKRKAAEEEAKRQAAAEAEAKRKAAAEAEAKRKAAADEEAKRKAAADEEAKRKGGGRQGGGRQGSGRTKPRLTGRRPMRKRGAAPRAEEERRRRDNTQTANVPRIQCQGSLPSLNAHYEPTDCGYVQEFYNISMTSTPPGVTNRWRNSRTGNSGTVTVGRTYSANGQFCRKLDQTVVVRGQTHTASGTVCQSPGGPDTGGDQSGAAERAWGCVNSCLILKVLELYPVI